MGIKEAHNWAPFAHSPWLAMRFSCQMKTGRLTATVSPVRQGTSRTRPPPAPAASRTPGEGARSVFLPPSQPRLLTAPSTAQLHGPPPTSRQEPT